MRDAYVNSRRHTSSLPPTCCTWRRLLLACKLCNLRKPSTGEQPLSFLLFETSALLVMPPMHIIRHFRGASASSLLEATGAFHVTQLSQYTQHFKGIFKSLYMKRACQEARSIGTEGKCELRESVI